MAGCAIGFCGAVWLGLAGLGLRAGAFGCFAERGEGLALECFGGGGVGDLAWCHVSPAGGGEVGLAVVAGAVFEVGGHALEAEAAAALDAFPFLHAHGELAAGAGEPPEEEPVPVDVGEFHSGVAGGGEEVASAFAAGEYGVGDAVDVAVDISSSVARARSVAACCSPWMDRKGVTFSAT